MNHTDLTRRRFMKNMMAAGLSTCIIDHVTGSVLAAPNYSHFADPGRIIFQSSFEPNEPLLKAPQHKLVKDTACTGQYSMMGQVDRPNQACFLEIPFESRKGKVLHISYRVRSDSRSACATFIKTGRQRSPIGRRVDNVAANRWHHVQTRFNVESDTRGVIQIVAPSSHNAPTGRAWIDDVSIVEVDNECQWSKHVEDFPVLACDKSGNMWMAAIERPCAKGLISVSRLNGEQKTSVCTFDPTGNTAVFSPAIAGLDDGCVVAFAVEQDDRWRIAYSFIAGASATPVQYVDCGGNSNISPAMAVTGSRACIVWESNAGSRRGIWSAMLNTEGPSKIERISTADANSYNPSIAALPDGRLFAAWDSVREKSADIFGAWCKDGKWQKEFRITSGARIERHPHLALRNDEVWMAWQAQSYPGLSINALREQLIGVARIDKRKLLEGKDFICIPHQLADWKGKGGGNPPTDWSFVDERLQPVAEIFQARQSYEYLGCPRQAPQGAPFKGHYLQDAWAEGIVIGVIASPDHGGGRGKVGVWAQDLTRAEIFKAVRARHTFGTSGAKMALKFSAGEAIMGDKVSRTDSPIDFQVEATALRKVTEVVIFRNNEIVFKADPNADKCRTEWTDHNPPKGKSWYYARIQVEDEELAWSSPIWFL